jgi:hypothetical protein
MCYLRGNNLMIVLVTREDGLVELISAHEVDKTDNRWASASRQVGLEWVCIHIGMYYVEGL